MIFNINKDFINKLKILKSKRNPFEVKCSFAKAEFLTEEESIVYP